MFSDLTKVIKKMINSLYRIAFICIFVSKLIKN